MSVWTHIWKYNLNIEDHQVIEMPQRARLLSVDVQRGVPRLWAEVDQKAPLEKRRIWVMGTGNPLPKDLTFDFIGTLLLHDGELVLHVFG